MNRKYGLIGYPLGHSFSGKYFARKFKDENIKDASYELFELSMIDDLPHLLDANPDLKGFNVTIPYKESVIPYLDEIASDAESIGAVNTVKISHGKLTGFNTDHIGFKNTMYSILEDQEINKALVLGTGGASKAIAYALTKLDIDFIYVSRKSNFNFLNYSELDNKELIANHQLIINTTPLGTAPAIDECPEIPYHLLSGEHILYDLVYNPEETMFMKKGKEYGAKTVNGYDMLVKQAEEAWKIWSTALF